MGPCSIFRSILRQSPEICHFEFHCHRRLFDLGQIDVRNISCLGIKSESGELPFLKRPSSDLGLKHAWDTFSPIISIWYTFLHYDWEVLLNQFPLICWGETFRSPIAFIFHSVLRTMKDNRAGIDICDELKWYHAWKQDAHWKISACNRANEISNAENSFHWERFYCFNTKCGHLSLAITF